MRNRLFIWMIIFGAMITGCTPTVYHTGPMVKRIDSEALSKLVIDYSVKLKSDHRLYLEDSWVAYDDYIKRMCLQFSSMRLVTVEEARRLIVELVEGLLERVNKHILLSYELDKYPLTARELDVKINFESFHGMFSDEQYVGLIWLQCGCVHFYAFDRKDPNIDWDHHRFEPYSKSRELALIKKEADIEYSEGYGDFAAKEDASLYRWEGYTPDRMSAKRKPNAPTFVPVFTEPAAMPVPIGPPTTPYPIGTVPPFPVSQAAPLTVPTGGVPFTVGGEVPVSRGTPFAVPGAPYPAAGGVTSHVFPGAAVPTFTPGVINTNVPLPASAPLNPLLNPYDQTQGAVNQSYNAAKLYQNIGVGSLYPDLLHTEQQGSPSPDTLNPLQPVGNPTPSTMFPASSSQGMITPDAYINPPPL